jgi:hypothetical protein
MCPVATADADEKLGLVDAETKAVNMSAANRSDRTHFAFETKAWDVSILGFPGYVLTSE